MTNAIKYKIEHITGTTLTDFAQLHHLDMTCIFLKQWYKGLNSNKKGCTRQLLAVNSSAQIN